MSAKRQTRSYCLLFLATLAACGDSAGPDTPLVVDRVELSATSVTLSPSATQLLTAIPRAANGSVVAGRTFTWHSDDAAIVTVTAGGEIKGVALGTGTITASVDGKSAAATVSVIATQPVHLAAIWRLESFDGHATPSAYLILHDEPVGDRIIAKVEIRLDSATKTMASDATYQRRYYFTELHDDVVKLKYLWGDHGRFAIGGTAPVPLTLTSEYIQNLVTSGRVTADGRLALTEQLWLGDDARSTMWVRTFLP